jgi:hypothetical protein
VSKAADNADGEPAPYRVTVEVSWTAAAGAQTVRIQSLFWSPTGCRSTDTHPYAAPCQAFFYGKATVPAGTITIEPTPTNPVGVRNTLFDGGELSLGGANASVQQEQARRARTRTRTPRAVPTSGCGAAPRRRARRPPRRLRRQRPPTGSRSPSRRRRRRKLRRPSRRQPRSRVRRRT